MMFAVSTICVLTLVVQATIPNLVIFSIFWTLSKVASQIKYLAYSRYRKFSSVFIYAKINFNPSYTMEIIGPKWRAFAGQMNHIYYSLGCVAASILSFYFRDWQNFTYSVTVLHLPLLLFWFCVPESPREV